MDDDDIVMVDSDDDDDDDEDDEGEDQMNDEEEAGGATSNLTEEENHAVARRRAIQGIMRDNTLSDQEKRMRIQNLMSWGRMEVAPPPAPVLPQQGEIRCTHYERQCNIVAPCCSRVVGCRICHDETSPPGHPPMNRFM